MADNGLPPLPDGATLDTHDSLPPLPSGASLDSAPAKPRARGALDTLSDLGQSAYGAAQHGLGSIVRGVGEYTGLNGVRDVGKGMAESGTINQETTSPEFRAETSKGLLDSGGFTGTNVARKSLDSLGEMFAPVAASAITGPAAAPVGAALFGAQGRGAGAEEGEKQVAAMKDEQLAAVPRYQELLKSGLDPAAARAQLSDEVASRVGNVQGAFGAALGLAGKIPGISQLSSAVGSKLVQPLARGLGGELARPVARTLGEAAGQGVAFPAINAAGSVVGNVTNPIDTDPGQGALESAASGVIPGIVTGLTHGLLNERAMGARTRKALSDLPPPAAPPAPLQLGYEPDYTVDSQGRAIYNKGDRNLGRPLGGKGMEEQAPTPVTGFAGMGTLSGQTPAESALSYLRDLHASTPPGGAVSDDTQAAIARTTAMAKAAGASDEDIAAAHSTPPTPADVERAQGKPVGPIAGALEAVPESTIESQAVEANTPEPTPEEQKAAAAAAPFKSNYLDGAPARAEGEDDKAYVNRVVRNLPTPTAEHLPDDPSLYFNEQDSHREPINNLKPSRPQDLLDQRQGPAKIMASAAAGAIAKREPLSVRQEADGSYTVLDGNGTYNAAKNAGFKELPIRVDQVAAEDGWRDAIAAHKDLTPDAKNGLIAKFEEAEAVKPVFDRTLVDLTHELGLPDPKLAPIKGVARTAEKTATEYDNDPSRMRDIVRGTITANTPEQAKSLIDTLRQRFKVTAVKDSISPGTEPRGATGYRDANLTVEINGHPTEIQISTPEMLAAKKLGHKLYKEQRAIEAQAKLEKRPLNDDEQAQVTRLAQQQTKLYADAYAGARGAESNPAALKADSRSPGDVNSDVPPVLDNGESRLTGQDLPPSKPSMSTPSPKPEGLNASKPTASSEKNRVPAGSERGSAERGSNDIGKSSEGSVPQNTDDKLSVASSGGIIPPVRGGKNEPAHVERLRNSLFKDSKIGNALRRLELSGGLRIVDEPSNVYSGKFENGKLILNAPYLNDRTALGVALHEAGHAEKAGGSLRAFVGHGEFDKLTARLDEIKKAGGRDADLVRKAEARVEKAGTKPEHAAEERLMYFIEEARNAETGGTISDKVRGTLRQIYASIKAALYNSPLGKYLKKAGIELNASDYVALAEAAVRRQANESMRANGLTPEPLYSKGATSEKRTDAGRGSDAAGARGVSEVGKGQGKGWNEKPVHPSAIAVDAVHYSTQAGLTKLLGRKYGTNHAGAERARVSDGGIANRVYFYPKDSPLAARGESMVGRAAKYEQRLNNMYDMRTDPLDLRDKADAAEKRGKDWNNALDKAVVDAGFDGFRTHDMAVVLGSKNGVDVSAPKYSKPTKETVAEVLGERAKYLTSDEFAKQRVGTAKKLVELMSKLPDAKEMASVALAGKAKRGWYKDSADAILSTFGTKDAPRFAALLSALSPQTSVENNLLNALHTWKNWDAAGRPTDKAAIVRVLGKSVQGNKGEDSVLGAWINNSVRALGDPDPSKTTLSGPKVNSFMNNLRGVVDEVTNDAWMANYALVDQTMFSGSLLPGSNDPGKRPGYVAMSARTREAAAHLTKITGEKWTPAEVQETVWSWAKTAYELASKTGESVADLVKSGKITDDLIKSTPAFGELFNADQYRSILESAGLNPTRGADHAASGQAEPRAAGEAKAAADVAPKAKHLQQAAGRLDALRAQRASAEAKFSIPDTVGIAYPGDIGKEKDRIAQRLFEQPYRQLAPDDRELVDQAHQTSSAEANRMYSVPAVATPARAQQTGSNLKDAMAKMREIGRGIIRSSLAIQDRAIGTADAALEGWRTAFDKRARSILNDPKLALAPVIDYQNGRPVDARVKPFFDTMSNMLDKQVAEIHSFGKGYLEGLIENYYPQQWKDPARAEDFYKTFLGKRPIAGDKSFMKERVFKDYEAGIDAGFEPVSHNPVDMLMARYQSGEKLLTSLRIMKEMEDRGLAKKLANDERVPKGWSRVNDHTFDTYIVPDQIARDLNNYLDPGLNRFAAWRGFRWMQNFLLTSRLGLSAFHAGMTTLDSLSSHMDLAWRGALRGDLGGSLRQLGHAALAPVTAVRELAGKGEGSKLLRQWYGKAAMDVHTEAILRALTEGGANAKMSATDYNNSLHQFTRAWSQRDLKNLTYTSVPAAMEATTALIAHRLVPAQKMIARVHLLKFELDRIAGQLGTAKGDYADTIAKMNTDTLRQVAYRVNADVDDRLGQFNYNNLFWNKTFRDALHASVQSVGWNFGTLRLLLAGGADARDIVKGGKDYVAPLDKAGNITDKKMSRLTNRLGYLITLNAVVASLGAMTQYALTGKGPEEIRDYFFPKTGRKNNDDTDERLSFPSYVKDEWEFRHHPITTLQHKLHPSLSMMAELYNNKDFYGNQIYDPEANIPEEAKQFMTYLGKSMLPYSVTGAAKNASTGKSTAMTIAPFFGVTPAPGSVTKSEFQQYVADRHFGQQSNEGRSVKSAESSHAFSDALQAMRLGQPVDKTQFSRGQLEAMQRMIRTPMPQSYFGKLPFDQQMHALEIATPLERQKYGLERTMRKGLSSYLSKLPPSQRAEVRDKFNELVSNR
jgi:hypothetical protein